MSGRNERRSAGRTALETWKRDREAMIGQRKQNNLMMEEQSKREESQRDGGSVGASKNPWPRINTFCNFAETQQVGNIRVDKTRLKEAMKNRAEDQL